MSSRHITHSVNAQSWRCSAPYLMPARCPTLPTVRTVCRIDTRHPMAASPYRSQVVVLLLPHPNLYIVKPRGPVARSLCRLDTQALHHRRMTRRRTTVQAHAQLAALGSCSVERAIKPVCRLDTSIRGARFDLPVLEYGVSIRHTVLQTISARRLALD